MAWPPVSCHQFSDYATPTTCAHVNEIRDVQNPSADSANDEDPFVSRVENNFKLCVWWVFIVLCVNWFFIWLNQTNRIIACCCCSKIKNWFHNLIPFSVSTSLSRLTNCTKSSGEANRFFNSIFGWEIAYGPFLVEATDVPVWFWFVWPD